MKTTVEDFDPSKPILAFRNQQGRTFPYSANLEINQTRLRLTPLYVMPEELKPVKKKTPAKKIANSPTEALGEVAQKALQSRKTVKQG